MQNYLLYFYIYHYKFKNYILYTIFLIQIHQINFLIITQNLDNYIIKLVSHNFHNFYHYYCLYHLKNIE